MMYRNGENVHQDDAKATKWYRMVAEQGHERAHSKLDDMKYMYL